MGAQPTQRQGGVLPSDEHEMPERRHALDQPAEQRYRLRPVGEVAVVEDDDEIVVIGRHGVDDEIGEGAGVRRGAGRDRLREGCGTGPSASERRQHLARKPRRVAGRSVEADPGHRDGPVDDPTRHGDRLAVAGRCGDEGQSRGRLERGGPAVPRAAADGLEPRAPGADRLAPVPGSDGRAKSSERVWPPGRATERPDGRRTSGTLAKGPPERRRRRRRSRRSPRPLGDRPELRQRLGPLEHQLRRPGLPVGRVAVLSRTPASRCTTPRELCGPRDPPRPRGAWPTCGSSPG